MSKQTNPTTQTPELASLTSEELITKFGSKSAAIRAMSAAGMERGAIAKQLGIRYQHVRNVLVTQLTKKAQ